MFMLRMYVEVDNEVVDTICLFHAIQMDAIQMYGIMHNWRSTKTMQRISTR